MRAALDDAQKVTEGQDGAAWGQETPELDAAQERYDEAANLLRKARKPLLKASEDLATFNSALAAAILSGHLTAEQKEDALESRVALAVPFGIRVSKFAAAYRDLVESGRLLAEAEKAAEAGTETE